MLIHVYYCSQGDFLLLIAEIASLAMAKAIKLAVSHICLAAEPLEPLDKIQEWAVSSVSFDTVSKILPNPDYHSGVT